MSPADQIRLVTQLRVDEGCVLHAYKDSLGYLTIGYGRLIDPAKGGKISEDEALYLLGTDVRDVLNKLEDFEWYRSQDSVRQCALANLGFNLGINGLLNFRHFLAAMFDKDYPTAAAHLKASQWYGQVGSRADRIIHLIETGVWP